MKIIIDHKMNIEETERPSLHMKNYLNIMCFNSLTPVTMNPMMNITIQ